MKIELDTIIKTLEQVGQELGVTAAAGQKGVDSFPNITLEVDYWHEYQQDSSPKPSQDNKPQLKPSPTFTDFWARLIKKVRGIFLPQPTRDNSGNRTWRLPAQCIYSYSNEPAAPYPFAVFQARLVHSLLQALLPQELKSDAIKLAIIPTENNGRQLVVECRRDAAQVCSDALVMVESLMDDVRVRSALVAVYTYAWQLEQAGAVGTAKSTTATKVYPNLDRGQDGLKFVVRISTNEPKMKEMLNGVPGVKHSADSGLYSLGIKTLPQLVEQLRVPPHAPSRDRTARRQSPPARGIDNSR